ASLSKRSFLMPLPYSLLFSAEHYPSSAMPDSKKNPWNYPPQTMHWQKLPLQTQLPVQTGEAPRAELLLPRERKLDEPTACLKNPLSVWKPEASEKTEPNPLHSGGILLLPN